MAKIQTMRQPHGAQHGRFWQNSLCRCIWYPRQGIMAMPLPSLCVLSWVKKTYMNAYTYLTW